MPVTTERTLIILKPDAVQRGLMGRIIGRFEEKGLRVAGAKFMLVPKPLAETHYGEHKGKPFYDGLIKFVTASPVLVMCIEGDEAIAVCRNLIGSTNGKKAAPGTIRGDFGLSGGMNLIHGSDSADSAKRELELWFKAGELVTYTRELEKWVYE